MNIEHRKRDAEVLPTLLESHKRFLAFLEHRVASREDAEEILQSAFAKAVQQENSLQGETVVAWFFQVLRTTLIDHYRHKNVEKRAIERHQAETEFQQNDFAELENTVCECFRDLLPTLKPEYAELLKRVDLGGQTVLEAATQLGITPNNAAVRLHRARLALKKRLEETCRTCAVHGCYDCTCGKN
jgi:RNA polymerase sigma-70 factor (ECF subfamily)